MKTNTNLMDALGNHQAEWDSFADDLRVLDQRLCVVMRRQGITPSLLDRIATPIPRRYVGAIVYASESGKQDGPIRTYADTPFGGWLRFASRRVHDIDDARAHLWRADGEWAFALPVGIARRLFGYAPGDFAGYAKLDAPDPNSIRVDIRLGDLPSVSDLLSY